MEKNRKKLLEIDKKIIALLSKRLVIAKKIGNIKLKNNIEPLQAEYWEYTETIRQKWAFDYKIDNKFVKKIFDSIRKESLKVQKQKKKKNEK